MKLEVLWRQLVGAGAEHLVLNLDGDIRADSLAVGEVESTAYRIHYMIECDAGWNVQRVQMEDLLNRKYGVLKRDENNLWTDEAGNKIRELDGCSQVDIMITPFTNTLPIRRLNLQVGESRPVAVAYISLPGLKLSRMEQRYTCLSKDENGTVYRYESLKSGFTADLKVDTDGLVVDYPNIFEMDAKRPLE
ncbi:MAG: putative glycolipid-binding domain-containing protein [Anaerolineae bacterium]